MNPITHPRCSPLAAATRCGWLACWIGWLSLAAGCAGVNGAGRNTGRPETELRGLLTLAETNAPAGSIALLNSRSGTRAPCYLRTRDAAVADDIRTLAAKGAVVIVAGQPCANGVLVTAVWPEGKRRPKSQDEAMQMDDHDSKAAPDRWPDITWGSPPARDK